MKLRLNKKNIKNLSLDSQVLPSDATPKVAGGFETWNCPPHTYTCTGTESQRYCAPIEDSIKDCDTDTAYPC